MRKKVSGLSDTLARVRGSGISFATWLALIGLVLCIKVLESSKKTNSALRSALATWASRLMTASSEIATEEDLIPAPLRERAADPETDGVWHEPVSKI